MTEHDKGAVLGLGMGARRNTMELEEAVAALGLAATRVRPLEKAEMLTERNYEASNPRMSYEEAMVAIKNTDVALRATRALWATGRGQTPGSPLMRGKWVGYMPSLVLSPDKVNARTQRLLSEGVPLKCEAYLVLADDSGNWKVGWVPTKHDVLAQDWMLLERPVLDNAGERVLLGAVQELSEAANPKVANIIDLVLHPGVLAQWSPRQQSGLLSLVGTLVEMGYLTCTRQFYSLTDSGSARLTALREPSTET